MEKEIWTIDDIIKDYEDKGVAGRSKIEFLENVKKILDGRLITTISVPPCKNKEEYEELLQTIKDQLKEKLYIPVDYSNPGPIINEIYLSKRYLKWEDFEFKDIQQKIKVKLGNLIYVIWYVLEHGDPCVELTRNQQQVITLYGSYPEDIQFFNNLHLEVIENE